MATETKDGLGNQTTTDGGSTNQVAAPGGNGSEGSEVREWMKDLPEPLKANKNLGKFADKAALTQAYVELEGKLGSSIQIPAKDAAPEERTKFFVRLGRPETPEKYDIPAGVLDQEFEGILRAESHKDGVSVDHMGTFVRVVKAASEKLAGRTAAAKAAEEKAASDRKAVMQATLRQEFGPEYEVRMANVDKARKSLFTAELDAELDKAGVFSRADFIRSLSYVGAEMGDSGLVLGKPSTNPKDPYDWMKGRFQANRE